MYKILIVDDNPLIRMGIKNMITWEQFHAQLVGSAQDGDEAIAIIEDKNPDLVITDIRMPGMDGMDLLKQIRSRYQKIETIVVSAYNEFEYAKEAIISGSINYILKQINPKELNEAIRQAIDKKGNISLISSQKEGAGILTGIIAYKEEKTDSISQLYEELKQIDQLFIEKLEHNLFRIMIYNHQERETIKGLKNRKAGKYLLGYSGIFEEENVIHVWERALKNAADEMVLKSPETLESRTSPQLTEDEIQLYCMAGNTMKVTESMHEMLWQLLRNQPFLYQNLKKELEHFMVILFPLKMSYENYIKEFIDKLTRQESELFYFSIDEIIWDADTIISKICSEYEKKAGSKKLLTKQVKELVDKNYMTDITPSKIAQLFFVSPAYLSRTFKQEEDMNLNNYITQVRMERAQFLLENTKDKITEIAKKVGYEDANYFTKVYKKYQGNNPKDSR